MVSETITNEIVVQNSTSNVKSMMTDEDYLKELKDSLGDFYETMIVEKDDEILLRFLRFTDYDIERSVERIHESNELMLKYRDQLEMSYDEVFTPAMLKCMWEDKAVMLFKEKDQLGRSVILLKAKFWNPDEIHIDTLFRAFIFGLDVLLESAEVQRNGIAIILDCTGIGHMKAAYILSKVTIKHIMQLVEMYQGGYPTKINAVFSVSTPFVGVAMYKTFQYLVKRKLRDRIHVNYSGPKCMHKHFAKEFLPQSLLGDVPDDECGDFEIFHRLRVKHNGS